MLFIEVVNDQFVSEKNLEMVITSKFEITPLQTIVRKILASWGSIDILTEINCEISHGSCCEVFYII